MRPVLTFDCYGTLVDFDLRQATLEAVSDRLDIDNLDVEEFLDDFRVMRFQAVLEPYRGYEEVLRSSLRIAMTLHGIRYRESDGDKIVAAVSSFGPFPEVPDALRELQRSHDLVIVTNSDDALIAENVKNIGVDFDQVITAEQARAYKPSREMFDHAWRSVGVPLDQITHVAQGWEYDIMPTLGYGLRRVWINRQGQPGSKSFRPYDELPNLSGLPALLGS